MERSFKKETALLFPNCLLCDKASHASPTAWCVGKQIVQHVSMLTQGNRDAEIRSDLLNT